MTHLFILVDENTVISKRIKDDPEDIIRAIEDGEYSLPPELTSPCCVNLKHYVFVVGQEPMPEISAVQKSILEKLAAGASMTQVAKVMGYTYDGIRYHIDKMKEKFNVGTRAELISIYMRYNPRHF